MYSGIIGHYLKDYNIPIKWFFGDVEDPLFRGRLAVTVRALRAIKNLKASKVALIGGIAPGFDDLYDDERTLIRRFDGIRINRLHEYSEVRDRAVAYSAAQVSAEMERIAAEGGDWPLADQEFHWAIIKASHNEYMRASCTRSSTARSMKFCRLRKTASICKPWPSTTTASLWISS